MLFSLEDLSTDESQELKSLTHYYYLCLYVLLCNSKGGEMPHPLRTLASQS